jgi:hypothetical protein
VEYAHTQDGVRNYLLPSYSFLDDPALCLDNNASYFCNDNYRDANAYSPELYNCHSELWSKALPNGETLKLRFCPKGVDRKTGRPYKPFILKDEDESFRLPLTSDTIAPSYNKLAKLLRQGVIDEKQANEYLRAGRSTGSFLIWPIRGDKENSNNTINIVRARTVSDRIDLTLGHLQKWYEGQHGSPGGLYKTFQLYSSYFELFVTFKGFADFFYLQDFISEDNSKVKLFNRHGGNVTGRESVEQLGNKDVLEYIRWILDIIELRSTRIRKQFAPTPEPFNDSKGSR